MAVLLNNTRSLFVGNALDVGCFLQYSATRSALTNIGVEPRIASSLDRG
jgi:hypothetical protein